MKLFYNATTTNFGDHMNSWLWPNLIPDILDQNDEKVLVGVGSLLKADLNRVPGEKYIFGTGSGYGNPPAKEMSRDWKVYAVRGPLTAKLFNFEASSAITDGAWLIDQLPAYKVDRVRSSRTIFIPHWTSAQYGNWKKVTDLADIDFVDPFSDGPAILEKIASSKLAIVESLHGAIFADYFRTPWIAVSSSTRILHFKWVDWCMSLGMEHSVQYLPPSDYLDFCLQGLRPIRAIPNIAERFFTAESFQYKQNTEKLSASPAYKALIRAKTLARNVRTSLLPTLQNNRDRFLVRGWNTEYRILLANYLRKLSLQPGRLSSDPAREECLERLSIALARFKADVSASV